MTPTKEFEVWFVTGSQHLYGPETLKRVAADSQEVAKALSASPAIPSRVVFKPVLVSPDSVTELALAANNSPACIGLIVWCHTFSPSKMWINGLKQLRKPVAHLHTQYNRDIPWSTIDMDFMNLNQAAHGDREFGFITARLGLPRKVVAGYWEDPETVAGIASWSRASAGWHESQNLKVASFDDKMREVAVTEGDKVEAQSQFGYSVNGYGIGDLVESINKFSDADADKLVQVYRDTYTLTKKHDRPDVLREAARIELGLRAFLEEGDFGAFTDNFMILHGLTQLPGIAVQRLMADGYGFGAEGDWKTAALLRIMKVMATGLKGGTSFMEDYTYDFTGTPKELSAHMLEVCPSIAAGKPSLEIHPLGIGGKSDPARLVFTTPSGPGIVASLIDMGNRFRMIVNEIDVIDPPQPLPNLPVASAVWVPRPNLKVSSTAWIYAGGAHHTSFSQALTMEHLVDFCEIAGVELIPIDGTTKIDEFRRLLRWEEAAYSRR